MLRPYRWLSAGSGVLVALALVVSVPGCSKGTKKPPPADVTEKIEKGQTILILASAAPNPNPKHPKLSKGGRKDEDHVRWLNQTGQQITIRFSPAWPFLETQADIVIENGKTSPYFTLDTATPAADYPYSVDPAVTDTGEAPGEPSITVEP